eukprot:3981847-Pleurochrysis_carterae.AAC.1
MIFGNAKFPGSISAWFPSLIWLVGECMLGGRTRVVVSSSTSQASVQLAGAEAAAQRSTSAAGAAS